MTMALAHSERASSASVHAAVRRVITTSKLSMGSTCNLGSQVHNTPPMAQYLLEGRGWGVWICGGWVCIFQSRGPQARCLKGFRSMWGKKVGVPQTQTQRRQPPHSWSPEDHMLANQFETLLSHTTCRKILHNKKVPPILSM